MTPDTANVAMFIVTVASAGIAAYSASQAKFAIQIASYANLQERQIDACADFIGDYAAYSNAKRVEDLTGLFSGTSTVPSSSARSADQTTADTARIESLPNQIATNLPIRDFSAKEEMTELLASLSRLEVYAGPETVEQVREMRSGLLFQFGMAKKVQALKDSMVERSFAHIRKSCVSVMLNSRLGLI
jgi:hypothetical protein